MSADSRPARVLLVDGDHSDIELTCAALAAAKLKIQVDTVGSGEHALAYLRKEGSFADRPTPDLVLLDVKMPGISGIETLHRIKADPAFREVPVIMLTGSVLDEDILRTYTEQAYAYMVKPVDVDSLRAAVERLNLFWFSRGSR